MEEKAQKENWNKNTMILSISIVIAAILLSSTMLVAANNQSARTSAAVTGTQAIAQNNQPIQPIAQTAQNNGKVVLEEFSDFQCIWCARAEPALKQIREYFKEKIEFNYKHFPLTQIHPNAFKAAEAAECAKEQGKFWEMHDKLFENQSNLSIADLKNYAKQLGLNSQEFDSCLDSGKKEQAVKNDAAEGENKGVGGTPTLLINGKSYTGQMEFEALKKAIEAELGQ